MEEWITQVEFAKRKGVGKSAVANAIKQGKIMKRDDRKINYTEYSVIWDSRRKKSGDNSKFKHTLAKVKDLDNPKDCESLESPTKAKKRLDRSLDKKVVYTEDLTPAQAIRNKTLYDSELSKHKMRNEAIKADKEIGKLVLKEEIDTTITNAAIVLKKRLLEIPIRLSPLLAIETSEEVIESSINSEIVSVLNEFSEEFKNE